MPNANLVKIYFVHDDFTKKVCDGLDNYREMPLRDEPEMENSYWQWSTRKIALSALDKIMAAWYEAYMQASDDEKADGIIEFSMLLTQEEYNEAEKWKDS